MTYRFSLVRSALNFMRFKKTIVYSVLLAFSAVGCHTPNRPDEDQGKAVIRIVIGTATCSFGETQTPATRGMELSAGTTITTAPDSGVYLSINGRLSDVRLQGDTTLVVSKMDSNETILDLKAGSILGQVKKLPPNYKFAIKTPHGVAAPLPGAKFAITAAQASDRKR